MKTQIILILAIAFGVSGTQNGWSQSAAAAAGKGDSTKSSLRISPIRRFKEDASESFGNGARLVREGDNITIIDGGRRYPMSHEDTTPPPAGMMSRSPCGTIKRYLDTHRCDSYWRHLSLWWADNCL